MSQKLFEVPATPVERVFTLSTYHGNRIAGKLMGLLKSGKVYKVKKLRGKNEFTTFEISIKSRSNKKEAFELLVNEILSYIPDNFPKNYIFSVGVLRIGFVYSFYLRDEDSQNCRHFSHKIKEINKDSVVPEVQILRNL